MLELNGELLPPAELGKGNDEMSLLEANQVELGSLHFTVDVSILVGFLLP